MGGDRNKPISNVKPVRAPDPEEDRISEAGWLRGGLPLSSGPRASSPAPAGRGAAAGVYHTPEGSPPGGLSGPGAWVLHKSMRASKPASRLKEGAKRRNAPTTQRCIQLPVVAGRTSPPRHVPKVHGAQKERRMSEPAGTQLDRARTKRSGHSGAAPKRVAGQPAGEGGSRIVLCRRAGSAISRRKTHTQLPGLPSTPSLHEE